MTRRCACVASVVLSLLWGPLPAPGAELDTALHTSLGTQPASCVPDSALRRCLLVVDTVSRQIAHAAGISAGRRDTLLMERVALVKLMCETLVSDTTCNGVTTERVGMALRYAARAQ